MLRPKLSHHKRVNKREKGNWLRRAFLLGTLAGEIAISTVGGAAAGYLADEYFGTSPIFIIVGLAVGFIGGAVLFFMGIKSIKF